MVKLTEIYEFCKDKNQLLEKLREWRLIPENLNCSVCGNPMKLIESVDLPDGWQWYCGAMVSQRKQAAKKCHTRVEFRKGTLFERSKLSIYQILGFCHFWARGYKLCDAIHELEIANHAACDWASFAREICLVGFFDRHDQLGGENRTVEIDESKFGRKKYWRGHKVEGVWVFGGIERETGRVFMETVEKRDAATLIPLLEKWVKKGTTVISDCWKAYDGMEGFEHLKVHSLECVGTAEVNHSLHFCDPETGANTNRIESSWRHAKESFSTHGRKKEHVPGNLARYMFIKSVKAKDADPTVEFFRLAGTVYDPTKAALPENVIVEEELDDEDIDLDEI